MNGRRWFTAAVLSAALCVSITFTRPVCEFLRARYLLLPLTFIALSLVLWAAGRRMQTLWMAGKKQRLAVFVVLLIILIVTAWAVVILPEERAHFFAMTLIGWAWIRAWDDGKRTALQIGIYAALSTAGVGILEESLQKLVPGRIFDWRDIGMNATAAVLSVSALMVSGGSRCECRSPGAASE